MTALKCLIAALPLLLASGCSKRQSAASSESSGGAPEVPEVAQPQRFPAPTPEALQLLARAGSDAAVIVALEDEDWPSISASLSRDLGASRASVRTPLSFLSKHLRVPLPELEHRDTSRPLVLSLLAPPYVGPAGYAFSMALPLEGPQPPVRHILEIPCESAAELLNELSEFFASKLEERTGLVEGMEGAQAFELPVVGVGTSFVALFPEDSFVRVVVLQGSRGLTLSEARAYMSPGEEPHQDTPALRTFAAADGTRIYLRPDNLRSYQSWSGVNAVYAASEDLTPALAVSGVPRGLAFAADTAAYGPNGTAELYDHAWLIDPEAEGIHLRGVATLTEQGNAVFGDASDHLVPLPAPREAEAPGVRVATDLARLLGHAGDLQMPTDVRLTDFARECSSCVIDALLRWPAAAVKALMAESTMNNIAGPTAFHLVWPTGAKNHGPWALAMTGLPRQPSAGPVALLERFIGVPIVNEHHDDVAFFSSGAAFSEVFDTSESLPEDNRIAFVRLDENTGASAPLELAVHASPGAIVYDVALGGASVSKTAPRAPFLDGFSQLGSNPRAENCLFVAAQQTRSLFKDTVVDRERLGPFRRALDCAAADPQLADAASRLGTAVTMMLATRAVAAGSRDDAIELLDWRCLAEGDDAVACQHAQDLRLFVEIELPSDPVGPSCVTEESSFPLFYKDGKVLVGTAAVEPRREALLDALLPLIPAHARSAGEGVSFSLGAAPDTSFRELRPLFEVVGGLGGHLLPVVLADSRPQTLSADLRWTASTTTDRKLGAHYVAEEQPVFEDASDTAQDSRAGERTMKLQDRMRWGDLVRTAGSCDEPVVFVGGEAH